MRDVSLGRRLAGEASSVPRIVPACATTSAGCGPARSGSVRGRCAPPVQPAIPRRGRRTRRSRPRTRRTGRGQRVQLRDRSPFPVTAVRLGETVSTDTGAPVASETIAAVAAARRSGEVQSATTSASRAAAPSARACTRRAPTAADRGAPDQSPAFQRSGRAAPAATGASACPAPSAGCTPGRMPQRVPRRRGARLAVRIWPVLPLASKCAEIRARQRLLADRRPAGSDRVAGRGLEAGERFQTLLGATGTGKTMTMAATIAGGPAAVAGDRAQQDARRAALQRVPDLLPEKRGRVLRLLLRLLPARGLRPGARTSTSRRTPRSTRRSTGCATPRPRGCSRGAT